MPPISERPSKERRVKDPFGEVTVPSGVLFDKATARWIEKIGIGESLPHDFISSLALVKKACAFANSDCRVLDPRAAEVIGEVCDEIIAGAYRDQFPVSFLQSGSGTFTNMNMNEVIARVAHVKSGGNVEDEKTFLHPNDDINRSQSTNDIFPTAMYASAVLTLRDDVIPVVGDLAGSLKSKGVEFWDVIKAGRTHLMDAVPMRLGMEFDAWGRRIKTGGELITRSLDHLSELPIGGTALGSGINAPDGFAERAVHYISKFTDHEFKEAENKAVPISSHDPMVEASSAITQLADTLISVTNNMRLLASGPRTGMAELILPGAEPGSSIMPGKVNPVILEAVKMACIKIDGRHTIVKRANAEGSELDLNSAKPVMTEAFLEAAVLMADACRLLDEKCVKDIKANLDMIEKHLKSTLMTCTALSQHITYDRATEIAIKALNEDTSLKEAAVATGYVTGKQFDKWVRPEKMV